MWFVIIVMTVMLAGDAWWWAWAVRRLRRNNTATLWPWLVHITMGLLVLGLLLFIAARVFEWNFLVMPEWAGAAMFIWHFVVLPVVTVISLVVSGSELVAQLLRQSKPVHIASGTRDADETKPGISRRALLARVVVLTPPVATAVMTGRSVIEADDVVIKKIDVPLKALPKALDGMTIAHVSDAHIGSFMSDKKYSFIIDQVNAMDADMVLQTGDLINASLADLPDGIQMMQKFRGRYGVYSCQGNHDCITDRAKFEADSLRGGVNLLLDSATTIHVRGHRVSLGAPRWWGNQQSVMQWAVRDKVLPQMSPDAFGILLAHHPHFYDAATEFGIPLTLSGHTHGGQIALSHNIGFGPLMYRYWNGLYQTPESACYVNVGAGNWFPLRINVPCEIVHLTLRCA
jgi:uncharacterized protein